MSLPRCLSRARLRAARTATLTGVAALALTTVAVGGAQAATPASSSAGTISPAARAAATPATATVNARTATPASAPAAVAPAATVKAKIKTGYSYSYAGLKYAVRDGGVNWAKPVGVLMYLDGDFYTRGYAKAISEYPNGPKAAAMSKVAAKRNMILVIPAMPQSAYTKDLGYTWWGKSSTMAPMIQKLEAKMRSTVGASKANTWYMGYSGGAEFITFELAKRNQGSYGYGGAILLAGGGNPKSMSTPPAVFKSNFDMHWLVGSKDGVGQSSNAKTWSAYKATDEGRKFYQSKGFATTRTVLNGEDHHSYDFGAVLERGFRDAKK